MFLFVCFSVYICILLGMFGTGLDFYLRCYEVGSRFGSSVPATRAETKSPKELMNNLAAEPGLKRKQEQLQWYDGVRMGRSSLCIGNRMSMTLPLL